MSDQPTAVPSQPQPALPPSQKSTGGFLDLKRNAKHLMVVLAIIGALVVGWVVFKQTASITTKGAIKPVLGGSEIIVNQSVEVTDDSWRIFTFSLSRQATVDLEFDVTKGDKVTAYLIDDGEREKFAQVGSTGMGKFRHYEALAGKDKKQHRAYITLNAGSYALVMSESSGVNLLGKADKATVRVKLSTR